jgi:hypothetical protein
MRSLLPLCVLLALAGCGGGNDADAPTLSVANGTLRISCGGADCVAAIVGNEASVTRTIDGVSEQRFLVGSRFTNVEFVTGDGNDRAQLVDVFVPGTIHISTGAGDDFFDICDAGARGDVSISAGPGDDELHFDGASHRRFALDLGDGDDYVRLEGFFGGPVDVDGGGGFDTVDWAPFPPPRDVTFVGFESDGSVDLVSESSRDPE